MPENVPFNKEEFAWESNPFSEVDKVIAVASGKGGVGKSLVTSLLACAAAKDGKETAIMDADVTGPSIPKAFGLRGMLSAIEGVGIEPAIADNGIKVVSMNLLLEDEESPVVWRGPVVAGVLQQFWKDVDWGKVDYMFVDMPPGSGDVPLSIYQSLPVDGIIVVTTPQDLVQLIVKKAYNMAKMMNVPILGVIENMSYMECPDCGKKLNVFGESKADEIAKSLGVPVLATMPIRPQTATLVDLGKVDTANAPEAAEAFAKLKEALGDEA